MEKLNREKRERVTVEDVEGVLYPAFERGAAYFHEWWSDSTPQEQELLHRLHRGDAPVNQDGPSLHRLIRWEILQKIDGNFSFQVPMMERYVAKLAEEMGI